MVGGSDFTVDAVQSRRTQPAPAGLGLQAVRLCGGARERAVAGLDDQRSAAGRRAGAGRRLDSPRRARDRSGRDDAARGAARIEQRRGRAAAAAVGTRPVLRLASDLGVTEQPDVPSLALGSGLVTPLDLTAAYAVFPNVGYRVRPRGVVSVVNANGSRVHQVHIEREQILSEQVSFQMVTMLQDVVAAWNRRRRPRHGRHGARSAARRERRASIATPGSSASTRRSSSVCGWASISRRRSSRARRGRAWRCRSGRTSCGEPCGDCPPAALSLPTTCVASRSACCRITARSTGARPTSSISRKAIRVPTQLCQIHEGSLQQRAERAIQGLIGAIGKSIRGHLPVSDLHRDAEALLVVRERSALRRLSRSRVGQAGHG